MKKFKFRLQPLLKAKEYQEKQRQREHAAALNNELVQARKIEELAHHRQDVITTQTDTENKSVSPAQLMVYSRYMMKLKKDSIVGNELLKALKKESERRRVLLSKAATERKTYEQLRENQQAEYFKSIDDAERKELDEMAIENYRLRRR